MLIPKDVFYHAKTLRSWLSQYLYSYLLYLLRHGLPLGEEEQTSRDTQDDLELDITSYTELWLLVAQIGRSNQ